jgi:hypothetical protein
LGKKLKTDTKAIQIGLLILQYKYKHLGMQTQKTHNRNITFILYLLVAAVVASSAFFFFPEVKIEHLQVALMMAFAASLTQLGAAVFFLAGLQSFKKSLRAAYYLVAAGALAFSLVQLAPSLSVMPVISNIFGNTVVASLSFVLPYLFGALCMYLGMRKFASLLGIPTKWRSFLLVAAASLVVALALAAADRESIPVLRVFIGLVAWCGSFGLAAAVLTFRIRRVIGPVYKNAMLWLGLAFCALTFSTFHEIVVKTFFVNSAYVGHQYTLWAYLLVGILFLRAGMAIANTGRRGFNLSQNPTYVDIVVGAAQIVSQPKEVDAVLDKVRAITAQSAGPLSAADKQALVGVYLYIEDYLVHKEPLQNFTKEELRDGLPDDFVQALAPLEHSHPQQA